MKITINVCENSLKEIKEFISNCVERPKDKPVESDATTQKEWLNLKEGAKYAGVSPATFKNFAVKGLPTFRVEGIVRVSRKDIDEFYRKHSI